MSQAAAATGIEADSYVVNPRMLEWGPGRVMQLEGAKAVVCFRDARAEAPGDGLKTMVIRALEAAPMQSDAWLDNLPPFKNGKFQVAQPRVTFDEGMLELVRQYPLGFADPAYTEKERTSRVEAHALWESSLGGGQGEALLADGDLAELAKRATAITALSALLNRVETAALRDGLADAGVAKALFVALFDVLAAEKATDAPLGAYFEAVKSLPLRGKTAAAKWPIATILPFIARPDAFALLRPEVCKPAAERLRFDLFFNVDPNAKTYEKMLRMANALQDRLASHGAQDRIDVNAYLGVVARYGTSRAQA